MKLIDLTGKKINMLKVIKRVENKGKRVCWLCKCDCGKEIIVISSHLLENKKYSCGCTRKKILNKKSKYGNYNKRIYNAWNSMKNRCYNKNNKEYYCYGNRNIKVCDEWRDNFMNFYNWSINNGYADNLTIDRINNNGNYEPSNCRWVPKRVNNLNRRGIIWVKYKGKNMCLKDYCIIENISYYKAKKIVNL